MNSTAEALKVEDLHKSFGAVEVLRGVSLTAHQGDVISIIGASGSGKSTLLRCINLLETPTSGNVSVEGETIAMKPGRPGGDAVPVDKRQVERIRTKLGMVFQSFNLWSHMTVMENVIEAPVHVLGVSRADALERAKALLEKVGITERADYYPAHLSGGQQQRAAIARALAMEPKVMLFDEPTSALDPELVGEVLATMEQVAAEGMTMMVATHEMGFAKKVADSIVFMDEGLIVEAGPPSRLFGAADSERLRRFLDKILV